MINTEKSAWDSCTCPSYLAIHLAGCPRYLPPISHVGQLPAGPMADRRTKRDRDRSSQKRHAIEEQS